MRVGVIHYNSHAIFDRLEFLIQTMGAGTGFPGCPGGGLQGVLQDGSTGKSAESRVSDPDFHWGTAERRQDVREGSEDQRHLVRHDLPRGCCSRKGQLPEDAGERRVQG